jgi:AraC-like DNA-binding protein/mannose-6-phosphate isomerase-like protein (cupin superfamily)
MVRNARAAEYEANPQPIIAIGNRYPAGHVHPSHRHRRAQLLYSATGVMIVVTEHGTWVVPPLRAVWIPGGVTHQIRMVGAVATRSIYIEPDTISQAPERCRVVGISPLLRTLLVEAVDLPLAYESNARAGHIMALILHEIASLAELPLCVPVPANPRLAERCRRFLEAPTARDNIDSWAAALNMSRRAFTRLFRRETGLSLAAWRQQACLVAALPRLLAGESVTTVALDLNYGSPSTFTTMFKRILGAAPRYYLSPDGER